MIEVTRDHYHGYGALHRINLGHSQVKRTGPLTVTNTDGSTIHRENLPMLLIREVMYCKPGKVRPLLEKFQAMNKLGVKAGIPKMRLMTDFCAERYWTLVAEMEVKTMDEFEKMMTGAGQSGEDTKEFENLMKGYHELVEYGRREIYKIEG